MGDKIPEKFRIMNRLALVRLTLQFRQVLRQKRRRCRFHSDKRGLRQPCNQRHALCPLLQVGLKCPPKLLFHGGSGLRVQIEHIHQIKRSGYGLIGNFIEPLRNECLQ